VSSQALQKSQQAKLQLEEALLGGRGARGEMIRRAGGAFVCGPVAGILSVVLSVRCQVLINVDLCKREDVITNENTIYEKPPEILAVKCQLSNVAPAVQKQSVFYSEKYVLG